MLRLKFQMLRRYTAEAVKESVKASESINESAKKPVDEFPSLSRFRDPGMRQYVVPNQVNTGSFVASAYAV